MITPINSHVPNTKFDLNSTERLEDKLSRLDSNKDKHKSKKNLRETTITEEQNGENSIYKIDHTNQAELEPLEVIDSNLENMKEKIRKVMDMTSETLHHSYHQQPTTSTFHDHQDRDENVEDEYESSSSFQYLNDRDLVEDSSTRYNIPPTTNTPPKRMVSPPTRKENNMEDGFTTSERLVSTSPRRRKIREQEVLIDEDVRDENEEEEKMKHSDKPERKYVTKEENEPKKYYRIATTSTGFLFLINAFMLYFGGEGKLDMNNLYGYSGGSSHLQRTAAVLFLVMGIVNLSPNIFGGEDGFSLQRAAEYFPLVVALLNVVVSAHYIFENIRASETFNWIAFCGLILFVVLNIKLASLSHPGLLVRNKKK